MSFKLRLCWRKSSVSCPLDGSLKEWGSKCIPACSLCFPSKDCFFQIPPNACLSLLKEVEEGTRNPWECHRFVCPPHFPTC